jgi:hypothetical protein
MWDWPTMLGDRGFPSEDLLYVIAVLVLAGIGAIADKIKRKMAGQQDREKRPPVPGLPESRREAQRPSVPPRPARPGSPRAPQPQPSSPHPPVIRQAPGARRPIQPRQVPAATPARPPQPVRRVLPEQPPVLEEAHPSPPRPASAPPGGRSLDPQLGRRATAPSVAPSLADEAERVESKPPGFEAIAGQELRPASVLLAGPDELAPVRVTLAEMSLAEIRRAIVLNEVLGLPVALRDPDYLARQG